MDFIDKINSVLEYIEENIDTGIDYNIISRRACCSVHHFQRIFSFITNIPITEYIRRRRLTLAAFDLHENMKIIDVSIKYGYSSPEAFSRAFKKMHGITPAFAKKSDVFLKAYPKLLFNINLIGEHEIKYKIIPRKSYQVYGIMTDIPLLNPDTNKIITEFWEKSIKNGLLDKFHKDIDLPYDNPLSAVLFNFRENKFSYMIYHEKKSAENSDNYIQLTIPAFTWVVFQTAEHNDVDSSLFIREMRKRIFLEWFPSSGYVHENYAELEVFEKLNGRQRVNIWIPIKKN